MDDALFGADRGEDPGELRGRVHRIDDDPGLHPEPDRPFRRGHAKFGVPEGEERNFAVHARQVDRLGEDLSDRKLPARVFLPAIVADVELRFLEGGGVDELPVGADDPDPVGAVDPALERGPDAPVVGRVVGERVDVGGNLVVADAGQVRMLDDLQPPLEERDAKAVFREGKPGRFDEDDEVGRRELGDLAERLVRREPGGVERRRTRDRGAVGVGEK